MARKKPSSTMADSPSGTDDFNLIKGIGPVTSQRLHDAGIYTYNQLAVQSPAELAKKVNGWSAKQIAKQDWASQAQKLATKKTQLKPQQKEGPKRSIRQHYENFTIEFLQDEKKIVRRTRVVHIQSGDADTWAGWEVGQLIDFLSRHAGVRIQVKKLEKKESAITSEQRPVNAHDEPIPIIASAPGPISPMASEHDVSKPSPEIVHPSIQSPINTNFSGVLRLKDFKVLPIGSDTPIHTLRQDQPYRIRLTLDLTNAVIPSGSQLRYKATVNFKQLGGVSYSVAEESGTMKLPDCVILGIVGSDLPPGLYRTDAFVKLFSDETTLGLMASLKGELIQVF